MVLVLHSAHQRRYRLKSHMSSYVLKSGFYAQSLPNWGRGKCIGVAVPACRAAESARLSKVEKGVCSGLWQMEEGWGWSWRPLCHSTYIGGGSIQGYMIIGRGAAGIGCPDCCVSCKGRHSCCASCCSSYT